MNDILITTLDDFRTRKPNIQEVEQLISKARDDKQFLNRLCSIAFDVKTSFLGEEVIEEAAFNAVIPCTLDPLCAYCPYWRSSKQKSMSVPTVLDNVKYLMENTSVRQLHLSGGSSPQPGHSGLVEMVSAIRDAGYHDIDIVVNCGACFTDEELAQLKKLRVLRVFSVFETLDEALFQAVKAGDDLNAKKRFAQRVADAGMQVGTGIMAGLGAWEDRPHAYAAALDYLSKMDNLACLYISKFRHAQNIQLNEHPECPLEEALALVACARLVLPSLHIRAAAGWRKSEGEKARKAGAGNIQIGPSFSERADAGCWKEDPDRE